MIRRHPHARPIARGFTLIELMITVAIVAILVAVALPNYTEYVRRGHRADARAALLQAAQWMERAATATGRYPLTAAFPANLTRLQSGRYIIALESPIDGVVADQGRTFRLTATPQGSQAGDRCGTYRLTHTGARDLQNATESVQNCWSR